MAFSAMVVVMLRLITFVTVCVADGGKRERGVNTVTDLLKHEQQQHKQERCIILFSLCRRALRHSMEKHGRVTPKQTGDERLLSQTHNLIM